MQASKKLTPNNQQQVLEDIYPFNPQENVVTGLDVFEVSFAKHPKNGSEKFSIIQEKDFLELKRASSDSAPASQSSNEENSSKKPPRTVVGVLQDVIKSLQKLTTLELIPLTSNATVANNIISATIAAENKTAPLKQNQSEEGDNNMPAGTESTPTPPTVTITSGTPTPTPTPTPTLTPVQQEAAAAATRLATENNSGAAKFMTQEQFNIIQETNQRIQQENQALRTMVRKGKIEQEVKKTMRHLPIKQEKLVDILLQMDSDKDGLHKDIAELLIQCDRLISKGKVFDEAGRRAGREDGQRMSAYDKIEAEARKVMKGEPKLRLEQAIDRVAQDNPKLHARYVAEMEAEQRKSPVIVEENDEDEGGESGLEDGAGSGDDDD